ncbi:unnamed protein product [Enterobius vermicularis]|uniref:PH domain-containing protein n=1 Tax=Enterobius vermicularis TaxID=51028 RepID=A0A0N4UZU9_ENTVE|nr:unnamed protein product [Enterobius vermicularis]
MSVHLGYVCESNYLQNVAKKRASKSLFRKQTLTNRMKPLHMDGRQGAVPPQPLSKTNALENYESQVTGYPAKIACNFAASSTESVQVALKQELDDTDSGNVMNRSVLSNPAWYRDDEGRTGYKPKTWHHNGREQRSQVKKLKHEKNEGVAGNLGSLDLDNRGISEARLETIGINVVEESGEKGAIFASKCESEPKAEYRKEGYLRGFVNDFAGTWQKLSSNISTENNSSSSDLSQVSLHSHKSVTFSSQVEINEIEDTEEDDNKAMCHSTCGKSREPCSSCCLSKKRETTENHNKRRVEKWKTSKSSSGDRKEISCASFLLNSTCSDSIIVEKESLDDYCFQSNSNTLEERSNPSFVSSSEYSDPPYGINYKNYEGMYDEYAHPEVHSRTRRDNQACSNAEEGFPQYLTIDFKRSLESLVQLLPSLPRSASGYFEEHHKDFPTTSASKCGGFLASYLENFNDVMQRSYYENVPSSTSLADDSSSKSCRLSNATLKLSENMSESEFKLLESQISHVTEGFQIQPYSPSMQFQLPVYRMQSLSRRQQPFSDEYLLGLRLGRLSNESIASSRESLMSLTTSEAERIVKRNFNY